MVGLEPTIPWSQATWGAAPLHPDDCQLTRVGFEPDLASLKDWQPHQKSNGPCLWAYLLCSPGPPGTVLEVGWKALESFSPGLQPGATPSQLPARAVLVIP